MTTRVLVAAAAAMIFVGGSHAHASTTHVFNLEEGGSFATVLAPDSLAITSDGLTATFGGNFVGGFATDGDGTITGGDFQDADEITRFKNGLGVCRDARCFGTTEPHSVDGFAPGIADYVEVAFSVGGDFVDVTLKGLTFGWIGDWTWSGTRLGYAGTTGAFEILTDDSLNGELGLGDQVAFSGTVTPDLERRRSRGAFDLSGADLFGNLFGVKAGEGGSWKLLAMTVEYDPSAPPPPPPPVVPLPGAIWLLLGGLGGLAALRKGRG